MFWIRNYFSTRQTNKNIRQFLITRKRRTGLSEKSFLLPKKSGLARMSENVRLFLGHIFKVLLAKFTEIFDICCGCGAKLAKTRNVCGRTSILFDSDATTQNDSATTEKRGHLFQYSWGRRIASGHSGQLAPNDVDPGDIHTLFEIAPLRFYFTFSIKRRRRELVCNGRK